MCKVAIINYGMGNLDSVFRTVEICGGNPFISEKPKELEIATHIILPGVGAFASGIKNLKMLGFDQEIKKQVNEHKIPLLGICLGMQLLSEKGWEPQETDGLALIKGEVKRLQPALKDERIPHVGWNEVIFSKKSKLFKDIMTGRDFYFVHSYHLVCGNNNVVAYTPYCNKFISAVEKENIFGVQFHPEKSQRNGLQLIKNFLTI